MARLSFGWLKPPKVPADGVMSLADHLRELRYRLILSMVVIVLGMVGCAFFYNQLVSLLMQPWGMAVQLLKGVKPDLDVQVIMNGVTSPLFLALKMIAVAGLVVTCPVWLYQVWAYIAPALLAKEKRYALYFLLAAIPLFLFGVAVGYIVLPQGITVMLAFTPDNIAGLTNLLEVGDFLNLMLQLMLVFGLGFLMPVVVVALNLMGVVSAAALKKARSYVMFGCFVFGAAATPGGDPFSMLALAIPMTLLFLIAEGICYAHDRRVRKKLAAEGLLVES
ncbi:twin-arginine translocase subunit TatC [Nigerium massiliense]|uniref:twin-arginine translocase subunit TatC n=1 Tax=Nigerium massiliense TaxID=1522317 RepID=UPI00058CC511|nr:twin-arginine translocase subunit TatC [Nigerium massiliense]